MFTLPSFEAAKKANKLPGAPLYDDVVVTVCRAIISDSITDLQVSTYSWDLWTVTFESLGSAQQTVGKEINVRGTNVVLQWFQPRVSSFFVCKRVPDDIDVQQALSALTNVLTGYHGHIRRSKARDRRKAGTLVVELDQAADIESFRLQLQLKSGSQWPATFYAWAETARCSICREGKSGSHPIKSCKRLEELV